MIWHFLGFRRKPKKNIIEAMWPLFERIIIYSLGQVLRKEYVIAIKKKALIRKRKKPQKIRVRVQKGHFDNLSKVSMLSFVNNFEKCLLSKVWHLLEELSYVYPKGLTGFQKFSYILENLRGEIRKCPCN